MTTDNATTNDPDHSQVRSGSADEPDPTAAGRDRRPTGGMQPGSETRPLIDLSTGAQMGWIQRRREKMVAEIQRNRRGDYKVPTWVLVAILVVVVAAWAAVIIFG
jgi:hypothetical protein